MQQVIARYGEISLKGRNRSDFERILERNMRGALRGLPDIRLERTGGRIMVTVPDGSENEAMDRLQRVFGVISLSPVNAAKLELDDMLRAMLATLSTSVGANVTTFKVEAKRANKRYPMKSPEIARDLGAMVLTARPDLRVDVHQPDITLYVEVRDYEALVYGMKIPAVGGMPVGSAGPVGLLLSGGIDSPVAGWLSLKRGVNLEAIHFHSFPFTSERALQKVETLAQQLANWAGRVRLHTVHFTEVQTEIRKHCPEELSITIMRRMMVRIAEEIAKKRRLLALVTGESLGQVASQTLESMHVINAVTNLPILRPLVAEDKVDIIRRARQIGTYETSILPYEDCCTIFVPKSPRTRPTIDEAEAAESQLDIHRLVADAVERTTMKTLLAEEQE